MIQKVIGSPNKAIRSWAFFDWANSAFALVITVAIFPVYFSNLSPDTIRVLGVEFTNSSVYTYSISLAYLLIAFSSPLFSGVADYAGRRRSFLHFFTILGGISCIGLAGFISPEGWWIAILCFMLGIIGFAGGLVFYNSFLPIITVKERYDRVSAMGFAYGYVGSVLLLIINLIIIQNPRSFGLVDGAAASRVSFVMVGLWWIGFGTLSIRGLPGDRSTPIRWNTIIAGYKEILGVTQEVAGQGFILRFLIAFFFYSAGVQTVLFVASTFGEQELGFRASVLILLILILQLLATAGAYLFAFLSKRLGNRLGLMTMISIWIGICISGYFLQDKLSFYILASFVGLVMGGIQSQSRSTYTKLMKEGEKNVSSYFSFYDLVEKVAIVMGTFTFALLDQYSGSMRGGLLLLSIYFIIGFCLLAVLRAPKNRM
jgi:UMF1 family MFS transporter